MANSTGINRKGLISFTVGMFFGVTGTYMFAFSSFLPSTFRFQSQGGYHKCDSGFIPDNPHSHGETDFFSGPQQSVNWADSHSHSHREESSALAEVLFHKVRVLCWVMTSPSNLQSKAQHVYATWAKRCNKVLFMSSSPDPNNKLPVVSLPVSEGRNSLWAKTKEAFRYVHQHHFEGYDWFMKADDDTFVVVENLRYFLSDKNSSQPLYYGRRFKPYVNQGYMSGGAGYVLSKEALRRFIDVALKGQSCRADNGGNEDLEMGKCLQSAGVQAADSRDELGRERFHPFVPEHHLIPGILPKDMWYWTYSFYPAKQGAECCSDNAISFHYVNPNMMYVLEYLIYHLKPYGIRHQCEKPQGEHAHKENVSSSSNMPAHSDSVKSVPVEGSAGNVEVSVSSSMHSAVEHSKENVPSVNVDGKGVEVAH